MVLVHQFPNINGFCSSKDPFSICRAWKFASQFEFSKIAVENGLHTKKSDFPVFSTAKGQSLYFLNLLRTNRKPKWKKWCKKNSFSYWSDQNNCSKGRTCLLQHSLALGKMQHVLTFFMWPCPETTILLVGTKNRDLSSKLEDEPPLVTEVALCSNWTWTHAHNYTGTQDFLVLVWILSVQLTLTKNARVLRRFIQVVLLKLEQYGLLNIL